MTVKGVVRCLPELIKLSKARTLKEQRDIITNSPSCIIYAISEICLNILNGNIPIRSFEREALEKHKK